MIARLEGTVQTYSWGTVDYLPALLGREASGEPQAELWLGAHPSAPSLVNDRPLDQLIADDPDQIVGARSVAEFGPRLPYLLKVLSAAEPLSLQAHPSRTQAEEGFAAEEATGVPRDAPERTYRDDWPKPEMLCALGPAEVLCGFREPSETHALFEQLGVPAALELVSPLRQGGRAGLAEVFARVMRLNAGELDVLSEVAAAATRHPEVGAFAQTAQDLAGRYPEDPGVLAALLMNRLTLQRDDAIFLPAGNLHAYLYGSGVEIMANSNNVLRGGLTSKPVNLDELLKVLDFSPGVPEPVRCHEEQPGVWAYDTPAPEFALWRLAVDGADVSLPATTSGRVLLVFEGSLTARTDTDELALARGQSAFLGAGEEVRLGGGGLAYLAAPGLG